MPSTTIHSTRPRESKSAQGLPAAIPASWCVGVVDGDSPEGELRVRSGELLARAKPAVGCLLQPQPGDSVACLRIAPDEVWVMSVLAREDEQSRAALRLPANTQVEAAAGSLTFMAPLLVMKGERLTLSAQQASLTAEQAEIVGQQLRVTGRVFKLVGSVLSSVMDRVQHFSRHYARTTEGLDQVRATHVQCEAEQLLQLSAEHALINSEKLLKARSGQIHFG